MSALARHVWKARERPQPRRAATRLPRIGMASPAPAAPLAAGSRALPQTLRGPGLYGALAASLVWHGALAAIILALLPPAPASEIDRGGAAVVMEVSFVDTLNSSAQSEGSRHEESHVTDSPVVEVPADAPSTVEAPITKAEPQAVPEPAVAQAASLAIEPSPLAPEAEKPLAAPAAEKPLAQEAVPPEQPRPQKVIPATTPKPAPKPVAKERTRSSQPTPREAKGKIGEGEAEASQRARSAAGTGGRSQSAGLASLTSYRGQLVAHLTRYKIYPESAHDRGLTGRNSVTITLTRAGGVASAQIAAASGHAILDTATLAAVRRAQPFPAIPAGGPENFTLTIGLNYELR